MKELTLFSFAVIATSITAGPVYSHHSDQIYDRDSIVVLEAEVTRYIFRNPHVTVFVEAMDAQGETVEWEIETGSTPIMQRSGWTNSLLKPGDRITVRAHPERTGRRRAILNTLETGDGSLWSQIERDPEATEVATSLAGVWKGIASTSLRAQIRSARLTPASEAAVASFDSQVDDPGVRCIANPPPFLISTSNYLSEIEILEDRIILRNEFFDAVRTVYMGGRDHPENGERTTQGHSIGWFEGEVLVVDTRLLADYRSGNGPGVPSGAQKHVVERYSLSEDGTRAIVDVMVEDLEFLAEPFVGTTEMVYVPHLQLYRYDCRVE